jgi:2-phospho-L-lactate transferase/gluconeogenesis factor (CofD/UPF0052 family)
METKYNIVIFSGGRGAATIISSLSKIPTVKLTILLNGYDDGLSTGLFRHLVPGMLGPSDFRKVITNLLKSSGQHTDSIIAQLLEYRFGQTDTYGQVWKISYEEDTKLGFNNSNSNLFLKTYFNILPTYVSNILQHWISISFNYLENNFKPIDLAIPLKDASLGNLLFIGAYLDCNRDFNKTIEKLNQLLNIKAEILNVTNGENRVLVGLKENGSILTNEAAIVDKHETSSKISKIYLLNDYLTSETLNFLSNKSFSEKINKLDSYENLPSINIKAEASLLSANMIVYGPGTQHSSLLPSYMTIGLPDAIAKNSTAEKIFISNINFDNDINNETHDSLIENLYRYMKIGAIKKDYSNEDFITETLISQSGEIKFSEAFNQVTKNTIKGASIAKWADGFYQHDGDKISKNLLTIASMKFEFFVKDSYKLISIIIPVLNEIMTLKKVLNDLVSNDWLSNGYVVQIIFVDGGSTDGSWELLTNSYGIIAIKSEFNYGRGHAIRQGFNIANGDIIITFPADNEYNVQSIIDVANILDKLDSGIVFGSRATLCIDTDERLKEIYLGKRREFFFSKWGGFLLSGISAMKFRRWLSDPLTSVKGFKTIKSLNLSLEGNSLDWDTRIIVDSWKSRVPIIEIPVEYNPRSVSEGKKTTFTKGLNALWQLVKA